jgi:predicted RNase H-like HicB family nuclease
MATTSFTVVLEPESDGGFSVYVPDLPGCASQGETQVEALANIREAIELHIEGLKADGMAVPAPRAQIATVQVKAA